MKTAKEMITTFFEGRKFANTKIVSYGKITPKIAYEISVVNNGQYCGQHNLVIVTENKQVTLDLVKSVTFENITEVKNEINRIKDMFAVYDLYNTSKQLISSFKDLSDAQDYADSINLSVKNIKKRTLELDEVIKKI